MSRSQPAIIVHGGAVSRHSYSLSAWRASVEDAARAGWAVLEKSGGTALDAVEAAIRSMESNPVCNAGIGSCLTSDGRVEMDAIIMNGSNLDVGAVACVNSVENPVTLARKVMEKTDHVLLVGEGANQFAAAEQTGIPTVSKETLITEQRKSELEKFRQFRKAVKADFNVQIDGGGHDTVGAVALDSSGNLAAGTSTGGITGKLPGRVGDVPIVGCGVYADNSIGAASTTGHGESIAKVTLARQALWFVEAGRSPDEAAKDALDGMLSRVRGRGGIIIISKDARIGFNCSTDDMAWAYCNAREGLKSGTNCHSSK
ncbi:isoaspartyl peptidase/L-asparaginase-like [Oscarella lobularis]|uniref:isoaspartyl peptidase/L-asparaginase-like n=1 Tax=Oscarella lobularis TaxID=121494 RepID=UPI0033143712